jgi:hypothetical protein
MGSRRFSPHRKETHMLRPSRLQFVAVIAALAIASVYVTGAFASKGGSGTSGSYSPGLSVVWPYAGANTSASTTPVPYVMSGCGYNAAFGGVTVVVNSPESISFGGQIPDSNGCISVTGWSTQGAGSYTINAYQTIKGKSVLVATTGFTVS